MARARIREGIDVIGATIRLEGGDQALRALQTLEPTVARNTKRVISKVGANLAAQITAASEPEPPVSGWRATPSWPGWSKVSGRSQRRGAGIVVTTTDSGGGRIAHMHEFIGNMTKVRTPRGRHLAEMMNQRLGVPVSNSRRKAAGRLGVRIINEQGQAVHNDIKKACDEAVAEVNRRMP